MIDPVKICTSSSHICKLRLTIVHVKQTKSKFCKSTLLTLKTNRLHGKKYSFILIFHFFFNLAFNIFIHNYVLYYFTMKKKKDLKLTPKSLESKVHIQGYNCQDFHFFIHQGLLQLPSEPVCMHSSGGTAGCTSVMVLLSHKCTILKDYRAGYKKSYKYTVIGKSGKRYEVQINSRHK